MKPRPEFVTRSSSKWEHREGVTIHGGRRADPARRTTVSNHDDDPDARTSRLVALVAGTYNGPQRRSTPRRWLPDLGPSALRVWDSAQDARNRATVRATYGEALPCPHIAKTLATRHARYFEADPATLAPNSWESVALEVLAILDRAEVPAGKIYDIADIVNDVHYRARGMIEQAQSSSGKARIKY